MGKQKRSRPIKYSEFRGVKLSPEYNKKLNMLIGDMQKKSGVSISLRNWIEEKIDEDYKNMI